MYILRWATYPDIAWGAKNEDALYIPPLVVDELNVLLTAALTGSGSITQRSLFQ